MKYLKITNSPSLIFLSALLGMFTLLFINHLWAAGAILLILLISLSIGEKVFLFFVITSFLTLTSTINIQLRIIVQVFNFLVLFFLFLKYYGLEFPRYPKIPKLVQLLLIFLYTSMILSTFLSDYFSLGLVQLMRLTLFFILVYIIYSLIDDSKMLKLILLAFFITGIIYSVTIFSELAQNNFNFVQMNLNQLQKIDNSYINMNSMGSFLVIVTSMALAFSLGNFKRHEKAAFFTLVIIFIIGLFITNSRAAILALILSSTFILFNLNKRILKIALILLIITLPLLFIPTVQEFIGLYFRTENLASGRNFILETIYDVILNNPVIGYGPAATKYAIYPNIPFMLGSPAEKFILFHYNEIQFGHAHNFFLFFWSDMGLPGLFTSLFLPFVYFKMCGKALQRTKVLKNQEYYYLVLALTGSGIAIFIRGLFEWGNLISYGTINSDLPFWIMVSILMYISINKLNPDGKIFSYTNQPVTQ